MDTLSKRYYERLTQDNAVLLFVDRQIGLFTGVRDIDVFAMLVGQLAAHMKG